MLKSISKQNKKMNFPLAPLVLVTILSLLFANTRAQNFETNAYKCPMEKAKKLDQYMASIFSFTESQRAFPERISEIGPFCNETKNDVKRLYELIPHCLTGTAKNFASIIMYAFKKTIKLYCNSKNAKRTSSFLLLGNCFNKNNEVARRCLVPYVDNLIGAKYSEPASNRIGYACCPYFKLLNCADTTLKCPPKSIESLTDFLRSLFQSIVDAACGDFVENSDRCDKLPAAPNKKKTDIERQTFMLPLIELWHNL